MKPVTIDQILESNHGGVILVLRQLDPWLGNGVLNIFQEKLNAYIDVVSSGQLVEKYPDFRQKPVCIRLVFKHNIPDDIKKRIDRVPAVLKESSIAFEMMQITVENDSDRKDRLKEGVTSFFKRFRK